MTAPFTAAITDAARDLFARSTPVDVRRVWAPHPGPQTAFVNSTAYEVLYGGAAGGGKTDALLYGPLAQVHLPGFQALFLRRTFPELQQAMDRAYATFPKLGAMWNEQKKRWLFPSGAAYEFGYAETYKDILQYQGDEYGEIAWDELGLIVEERCWTYILSRNRTTDPRVRRKARASANPGGPGAGWLKRRFIDRCTPDGAPVSVVDSETGVNLSRAFFAAKLADNPSLNHNAEYRATFSLMPEVTRRQLLDGDWSAGEGMALSELNREVHLVRQFDVPKHWYQWGALDWGFNHPFVAGWFAADSDGNAYLVHSAIGRRLLPHEIAQRIMGTFQVGSPGQFVSFRKFVAGHDCWNEVKARGENTPSIADQFREEGILLQKANISRASGLNNMRRYLTYGPDRPPRFRIMDTPTNRRVFETLESMVVDPDDPEDALKVDADEYGQGGDDAYDMTRYGLAARPLVAREPEGPEPRAFDPDVLKADHDRLYKPLVEREKKRQKVKQYGKGSINPF